MRLSSKIWLSPPAPEMPADEVAAGTQFYAKRLKQLQYDDRNKQTFNVLAEYCARYNAGRVRVDEPPPYRMPERGLLLFGAHGLGKSEFLSRFAAMMDLEIFDARDIAWEFQVGGAAAVDAMLRPHNNADIIIDDIGNEDEALSFGNAFSMATILDKRYRLWSMPNGVRTFLASNADRAAIEKLYGKAALSRIQGMCDVVEFYGTDRRSER
jgi:hypothetical protein